jgi:hypothetical protein
MARVVVLEYDPTEPVQRRRSKWRNEPVAEDGHVFDSHAERDRYRDLKAMWVAGEITDLRVHPRYRLEVEGRLVGNYIGDFEYRDASGAFIVEDVKSPVSRTPVYRLKKKLMAALWGIEVLEVEA